MEFIRLISTSNPLSISLSENNCNNQSKQKQSESTSKDSHHSIKKEKYEQQNLELSNSQYISQILLIQKNTICTVSQHLLNFYSINHLQNTNLNRYIGRVTVKQHIKKLFLSYLNSQQQGKTQKNAKNVLNLAQLIQTKEYNFQNPTIVQDKGVIYDPHYKRFYLLIETASNKYLIAFSVQISKDLKSVQKQNQISNKKERSLLLQNGRTLVYDFSVLYNFAQSSQQIKYSLQLSPQITYMDQSETLVLIRKFYNDSLVIVFTDQQQIKIPKELPTRKQSQESQTLSQTSSTIPKLINFQHHQSSPAKKIHWSFYINQDCLSSLDNYNFLINYRQLITKNYAEIDIIDIHNKEKLTYRINQHIEPMIIKSIQLLSPLNEIKDQQKHIESSSGFKIRIFSILRNSQASYILDYDVIHGNVENTYQLDGLFLESISFCHLQKDYYYVNFLNENKNYIGLLRKNLLALNEQIKKEQFMNDLMSSSVEMDLDSISWNIDFGLILQHKISPKNQQLYIKASKVVDKRVHYIKILDQLRKIMPIMQNYDLTKQVYHLLVQ